MGTKQEYKLENKSTMGKSLELDKGGDLNSLSLLIGMSHEIRTYVNAIVGFTSLLELRSYEEEANEFRDQIFKSCEQVVELYTGFLDSVLIDSGEIKTDTKICDLDNLLFNLISEFKEIFKKEGNPDVVFETEFNYSG